jgi:hypothetical protein
MGRVSHFTQPSIFASLSGMDSDPTSSDRIGPVWLLVWPSVAMIVASAAAVIGLVLWLAPSVEERFDRCMSLAERGGLLETRREDAALVCLQAATRRRGGGDESGPIVFPSMTGGVPMIIP